MEGLSALLQTPSTHIGLRFERAETLNFMPVTREVQPKENGTPFLGSSHLFWVLK